MDGLVSYACVMSIEAVHRVVGAILTRGHVHHVLGRIRITIGLI